MCLNPQGIPYPTKYRDTPSFERYIRLTGRDSITVPCGKCTECLKRKQQDLAARCARQAELSGSMQFLTLTYDNNTVPISLVIEMVDKLTGEITRESPFALLRRDSEEYKFFRDSLNSITDKRRVRYFEEVPFFETDDVLYRHSACQSLDNRDVQLWLKKARMRYLREFGRPISLDKYVVCGEYGPRTFRPHYHLALFGCSYSDAKFLADVWKEQFGFYYLESVFGVNKDGSSGFLAASRYVGKYMSKGVLECPSVSAGRSFKPRIMASTRLGFDYVVTEGNKQRVTLSPALLSYYRCYDLFGDFDISSGLRSDGRPLTDSNYRVLARESYKRAFFQVSGFKFLLPKTFLKEIWYEKNSKGVYQASFVRLKMSRFTQNDAFASRVEKLHQNNPAIPLGEFAARVREFVAESKTTADIKDCAGRVALSKFYQSSKF